MTTKFKKSFSPMLICWNDIKIHLGFEDSYFVPPPSLKFKLSHAMNETLALKMDTSDTRGSKNKCSCLFDSSLLCLSVSMPG